VHGFNTACTTETAISHSSTCKFAEQPTVFCQRRRRQSQLIGNQSNFFFCLFIITDINEQ